MQERSETNRIEEIILGNLKSLNQSIALITNEKVPPIKESSIHWISEMKAREIKQKTNQEFISYAFTNEQQIYFVKELFAQRARETKNYPPPLGIPEIRALYAVAHETIHLGCKSLANTPNSREVAKIGWEGQYQYIMELPTNEAFDEIKNKYMEINRVLKAEGDNVYVETTGATLIIGTKERPYFAFDNQIDEDFIDYLSSITILDHMKKTVKLENVDNEYKRQRQIWLINLNNRASPRSEHLTPLFDNLYKFLSNKNQRQKFNKAYFSGRFYEEYLPRLNKGQKMLFSVYATTGGTAKALDIYFSTTPFA